jgi:hypothetical protein
LTRLDCVLAGTGIIREIVRKLVIRHEHPNTTPCVSV